MNLSNAPVIPVLLAGGRGERFWPRSRANNPKQFLRLTSEQSLLIETLDRIDRAVDAEESWISTATKYKQDIASIIPPNMRVQVLDEPFPRNTAAAIGLVAVHLRKAYGDAVMIVLPADHHISHTEVFCRLINQAISAARKQYIVTLGIVPTRAETGYGYIERGNPELDGYSVRRFVEKPDVATAEQYLSSGSFLWNSGIYIFTVSRILSELGTYMPELLAGLVRIQSHIGLTDYQDVLEEVFSPLASVSIDKGVMENTNKMIVLPAEMGWDDVGDWLALERIRYRDGNCNVMQGDCITLNSHGVIVHSETQRLIVLNGVDDLVVVDCNDVVMISSKAALGNMRQLVSKVKEQKGSEFI